jgi:hypothetical protein
MVTKAKIDTTEDVWESGTKETSPDWVPQEALRQVGTITLKGGSADSWVVFHPTSIEHGLELLNHESLSDLLELAAQREAEFARHIKTAKGAGFSKPAASTGFKKPAAKAPVYDEDSDTYDCEHGERTWVTGRSGKGPWQAWMCPADKNDRTKCDPLWANKDGSLQNR